MAKAGVAVNDVSQAFDCTRQTIDKLMTRYVHTCTVRDRQWPGRSRATTARTDLYYFDAFTSAFCWATVTGRRYGLSAQTIRNRLRKNSNTIRERRPYRHFWFTVDLYSDTYTDTDADSSKDLRLWESI